MVMSKPDRRVTSNQGRRRRGERGASLVEYTLIVALLVVPTIGGIKLMQNAAASKISATAVGISTHTIPSEP